jgi:hypothetical protein
VPTSSPVSPADEVVAALDNAALLPALRRGGRVWVAGGPDDALAARLSAACPECVVLREPEPGIDLLVSLGAFREMTLEEVDDHVRRAHELGCRYVYSFDPRHEADEVAGAAIGSAIARLYWPHEVPVLGVGVPEAPALTRLPQPRPGRPAPKRRLAYRHLVGWRRLCP